MRTKVPVIALGLMAILFLSGWRTLQEPFLLWVSGVASGLFFATVAIEFVGWCLGKPVWLTTKP